MSSRSSALLAVLCSLLAFGVAAEETGGAPLATPFVGVWALDLEASDSVEPMLEAMEAPWIARKMADSMAPTLTVSATPGGGLRIQNENPLRSTEQEIAPDGVEREARDAMDRRVLRTARWGESGRLVVTSRNYVEKDRFVAVESTWAPSGDTLVLTNRLEPNGDTVVIRRVFRRQPDAP